MASSPRSPLNLGIVAHVDAGKTSLTERLLFDAGVISKLGSVDRGTTQTDTLDLERRRGITIKAAVVSFTIEEAKINLIDTPGHSEFIAEVERALLALDAAVLVISAVEGVQAHTRVLMRTLKRLRIPTVFFVNKVDRMGAQYDRLLGDIAAKLTPQVIAMSRVSCLGAKNATVTPCTLDDDQHLEQIVEVLGENDESLLDAYLYSSRGLDGAFLERNLAAQTKQGLVHPIYFGSAITGAGVPDLVRGIRDLLEPSAPPGEELSGAEDLSGTVFKIERGRAGEKVAYVRLYSGAIGVRDRVVFSRRTAHANVNEYEGKVTAIHVFEDGRTMQAAKVSMGNIGKIWGLADIQIGDQLGRSKQARAEASFAPPTLETVIKSKHPDDRIALHAALQKLAEQDPLINIRRNDLAQETTVCLYGEVQREVLEAQIVEEFGIEVEFEETRTIHVERVIGTGEAYEHMGLHEHVPIAATVGLRIEPAPPGAGVTYEVGIEPGLLLRVYHTAIEETVYETLHQGLFGWDVPDCKVTLTLGAYDSIGSTGGDFRAMTALVLMAALLQAGTQVCEPLNHFELEVPKDTVSVTMAKLIELDATPENTTIQGESGHLDGRIPARAVHNLERQIPGLTRGEGIVLTEFAGYRPVTGTPPRRARTDANPLNRKEYLSHLAKRG
ncbi:elongation factor G [Actinopolymorpha alba]|uniref:elongation factor G n=1 Tax=Actinopolymorpha alba TaxID=533267 RepID=UPI0003601B18|nr:TetM/TetW/TetO/TetS family tetracycline resistance ribosomal protection protein [Actinopolymorpha alba]